MEHIAISVIVPIYNTKPYLAECIESILAQKINVPIEVLLIDDGSTDGCGEVCDKYAARDERVRVIHQENQGLSAARNAGIDAAKGRYYSFIDSDDVVLPRFLQTLYDACEEHDAYMSLCSVEDVQEDGKSCDPAYFTRPTQEGVFCGKDLLNEFYTPYGTVYTVAWNKMYRAEVWKLLHYPEGRLHEDDFVAHRLFWRCDKVVCIEGDGSSADTDRTDGFNKYLLGEVEYNGKKIDTPWTSLDSVSYSGSTGWNPANAQAYFETYMSNADNADTKYIAAWDSGLALAVCDALAGSAIDDATKEAFLANGPFLTGCGGPKSIYAVIAGDYTNYPVAEQFGGIMDVTYPPAMIQDTIQALVDYFDGKDVPQENTQSAQCVTADNVAEFMDKGFE